MDFPIAELMDEKACYDKLVRWLHPGGLKCPERRCDDRLRVHRRDRDPILDYRCWRCNRVFNAYTGTALQGTKRRPVPLLLILRGFAQGVPTAQLARELGCDRMELLKFRHRLQGEAFANRDLEPLGDRVVEADEAYQNAGEKGSRTATPRTRRDGGRTSGAATGRTPTTGRRSAAWSAARGARSS
jgi:transposase-like protein